MKKILGIDLGTTNTLVSVYNDRKIETIDLSKYLYDGYNQSPLNPYQLPSTIAIPNKELASSGFDKYFIGNEADQKVNDYEFKNISSIKTIMSNEKLRKKFRDEKAGINFSPVKISAAYLKAMKDAAIKYFSHKYPDESVDITSQVVITVPAKYASKQRKLVLSAAKEAGFKKIELINEPTAAVVDLFFNNNDKSLNGQVILAYDFGGGTFDVSLIRVIDVEKNSYEVLETDGDLFLGGDRLDKLLYKVINEDLKRRIEDDWVLNDYSRRLYDAVVNAKIELSKEESVTINLPIIATSNKGIQSYRTIIERELFEKIISNYVEKTIDISRGVVENLIKGKDKFSSIDNLDKIVVVGGSSRIPLIKKRLEEEFGIEPDSSLDFDLSVSRGAAIMGASLANEIKELKFNEILTNDLGLIVDNDELSMILPKGTRIPNKYNKSYIATEFGQSKFEIKVYQGNSRNYLNYLNISTFEVTYDVPKNVQKIIDVQFEIDHNGEFTVSVVDNDTGEIVKKGLEIDKY